MSASRDAVVPYEDIDPLIRELVRTLNDEWGLQTTASCEGHQTEDEAYVSFVADRWEAVRDLLEALPINGWSGGFVWNRPIAKAVWTTVAPDERGLRYDLRLCGYPAYARRELISEVEQALRRASPKRRRDSAQAESRLFAATG